MVSWGAVSGTILGTLFLMFFILMGASIGEVFPYLFVLLIPAFIFGGIPSAFLGFIESFFLKRALRDTPEPFTKEDMKDRRWSVYRAVFPVPIAFSIILSLFLNSQTDDFSGAMIYWFLFGIPTLIASFASMFAANHYLYRVYLWSESQYGRKSKVKNEEYYHLMKKSKNHALLVAESENIVINKKKTSV